MSTQLNISSLGELFLRGGARNNGLKCGFKEFLDFLSHLPCSCPSPPTIMTFSFITTPMSPFHTVKGDHMGHSRCIDRERTLLKITQQVVSTARAESRTCQHRWGRLRPCQGKPLTPSAGTSWVWTLRTASRRGPASPSSGCQPQVHMKQDFWTLFSSCP